MNRRSGTRATHDLVAFFVDAYAGSIGRDACQLPTVRWVEPLIPTNPAAPIHPNASGMQAYANMLLASMHANGF